MKIQLSPTRIVKDALTCWHEHGPEVDMVVDLKKLPFAPGSIEALFSFHVLDRIFESEVLTTLKNWTDCMKPGGKMFVVANDFEFIARALIGGDINIYMMNKNFVCPSYYSRDSLVQYLIDLGIPMDKIVLWHASPPDFKKELHELVINV